MGQVGGLRGPTCLIMKVVPSDPFHPFCPPLTSASGNHQSVLHIYELGVLFWLCFILDSTYK